MLLQPKQNLYSLFLVVILAITIIVSITLNFTNRTPVVGATDFNKQKQLVEEKKSKINENLGSVNVDLENARNLGNTLKEELASKDQDIKKTETAIATTNELISLLEVQIAQNQKLMEETIASIQSLFLEMQKQQSPLQSLLSSENLSDALSKLYSTSLLQSKADEYRVKLDEATASLEEGKIEQLNAKKGLEESRALLASQKSYLNYLKEQTENDEQKYQARRESLMQANKELEAQFAKIEQERIAEEIAAKKRAEVAAAEAEAKRKAQQTMTNKSRTPAVTTSPSTPRVSGGSIPGNCSFEETRPLNAPSGYFAIPVSGFVVRGFALCTHDAVDIANSTGTTIVASAPGTIYRKGFAGDGYGNFVVIKHVLPSNQVVYTLYAHMVGSSPRQVGDNVGRGETVGYMGSTGNSTGSHLHFMIYSDTLETSGVGCRLGDSKCYDPLKYINF